MVSLAAFLAHLLVVTLAEQDAVRLPVVAVRGAFEILPGNLAQQSSKGGFTAVSNYVSRNLPGALTKCCPQILGQLPAFYVAAHGQATGYTGGNFAVKIIIAEGVT